MLYNLWNKLSIVTEKAAISAFSASGKYDSRKADQLACDAMRKHLNQINIDGTIVIGEGERDDAPMLFIGEKVGTGIGSKIDIAVDPLEGTTLCAELRDGAMSVLVASEGDSLLAAPDIYMEKIAIGKNLPEGLVSLRNNVVKNINILAEMKNCKTSDLKIITLKRARHEEMIAQILSTGASIKLIDDGDISAILSVINDEYDMFVGTGGAPEGVISSSAIKNLGGQFECRLSEDKKRNKKYKTPQSYDVDYDKIYTHNDIVRGDSIFVATGITNCNFMNGVKINNHAITTETFIVYKNQTMLIKKSCML